MAEAFVAFTRKTWQPLDFIKFYSLPEVGSIRCNALWNQ
jgi:hypothetical protein